MGTCRCAVACRAQEAQAVKQGSRRSGAVGVTFEFNDSARSLAVARQGAAQRAGGEGACRFLYQTQDPWCVMTVVLVSSSSLAELCKRSLTLCDTVRQWSKF